MREFIRAAAVPFTLAAFFFLLGVVIVSEPGWSQEPAPAPAPAATSPDTTVPTPQPPAQPPGGEQQPGVEQQPGAEPEQPKPEEPFAVIPSEELEEDPAGFPFDVSIEYAGDGSFFPYKYQGPAKGRPTSLRDALCAEFSSVVKVNGELRRNGVDANAMLEIKVEAYKMDAEGASPQTLASRRFRETPKAKELDVLREVVMTHRICPQIRSPYWVWYGCGGPVWVTVELRYEDVRMRGQNLSNNKYTLRLSPPGTPETCAEVRRPW